MKKIIILSFLFLSVQICFAQMGSRQPNPQLLSQPTQGQLRELFAGPATPEGFAPWLDSMKSWRDKLHDTLKFDNKRYSDPALAWTKTTFIYAQMMSHDRYFFDREKGEYTVNKYLDDLVKRYGGLDAVLIWPTYPNIGIDNRNQMDYWDDMPGGLKGITKMVNDFHKRNVKVFFPIMIWDHGTRRLQWTMATSLMKALKEVGADGLNGDTMFGVTDDYASASDSLHYPAAFQPELSVKNIDMLAYNHLSWGYFWNYQHNPGVSIYKWFEPQHQVNITNRWATNKTNDLQYAFFNGIGYNTWENIWGIWNQVTERHAAAIKAIRTIYKQFPAAWSNKDWTPHVPVLQKGTYASKFPGKETIYTFVNRDSVDKSGAQITLPYAEGAVYLDIWNGKTLTPERSGDKVTLSFPIELQGYGAVAVVKNAAEAAKLSSFLKKMNALTATPLQKLSGIWKEIPQQITAIAPTKKATAAPEGMVLVPSTKEYKFESIGVMIEGNELPTAIGIQHPWEAHPARTQTHVMEINEFYIDKTPVTNKQYKAFIDATKYRPKDDHNFLRSWVNGSYPAGAENQPVTWVSLEDSRAYANWAGKRLPHEWEWQYAAQGTDGRLYPWGAKDSTRMPEADTSRNPRVPTNVDAYPQGASALGILDLVGNVWQWTDQYNDAHTSAAVLKGGSYFHAQTSRWYFPQAKELNKYGKYLLMSPGLDRAATIGFRCVVDK